MEGEKRQTKKAAVVDGTTNTPKKTQSEVKEECYWE
jgi:hypothetical protein